MSAEFNPSPDFVEKTMQRIWLFEAARVSLLERLIWSRTLRYALTGGGTVFGILKALPVF